MMRCPSFAAGMATFLLLAAAGGILGGCSSTSTSPARGTSRSHFPTAGTSSAADEEAARRLAEEEAARRAAADAAFFTPDPETGSIAERTPLGDFSEGRSVAELPTIYFAYDSDELLPETRARLRGHDDYLKANRTFSVMLRGHTDERGTEEYNLALGSRRALAVREYLVNEGVPADRLNTISLGLYEPAEISGTEESHARNRRVEFRVLD